MLYYISNFVRVYITSFSNYSLVCPIPSPSPLLPSIFHSFLSLFHTPLRSLQPPCLPPFFSPTTPHKHTPYFSHPFPFPTLFRRSSRLSPSSLSLSCPLLSHFSISLSTLSFHIPHILSSLSFSCQFRSHPSIFFSIPSVSYSPPISLILPVLALLFSKYHLFPVISVFAQKLTQSSLNCNGKMSSNGSIESE